VDGLALQFCRFDQQLMVGSTLYRILATCIAAWGVGWSGYRSGRWGRRSTGGV